MVSISAWRHPVGCFMESADFDRDFFEWLLYQQYAEILELVQPRTQAAYYFDVIDGTYLICKQSI